MSEPSMEVLAERLEQMRVDIRSLARSINDVTVALKTVPLMQKDVQTLLENQRDFESRLKDMEDKVDGVLRDMPGLKEVRKWVITAVIAVLSVVGGAVLKTVIFDPQQPRPVATETK